MQEQLYYAAGYYPLMHEKEDWEKDIQTMKACHINLIRTAELFNTWDRIEPEEGKYNFDFLDEFFSLCEKYNMKILLGTGTASPPFWLHKKYPDVNILNNHNEQYPNNVSYSWACIDHAGYLKECERYIKDLVNRYKNHPALYAYQIHNEIGFPFMSLRENDIDMYCFCDYSTRKFQQWLKNKYKDLDHLNYAYRWGATNTVHNSFEEVIPPKTKPTSWSSVTRWLDFRLFWMDNYVKFVKWQNDLIKTMDQAHPTSTNTFFLKGQDPLGVITGIDQFEMAKAVDFIGYDLYPGSGDKLEQRPEFSSMFLDMCKSTVMPLNKNYWILETESGPINGWVLGPSRNVKGFDLERNIFENIGHGAKLNLYQGFREWDFQPLHWGALVDLDGHETERTKAAKYIGSIIEDYSHQLLEAKAGDGKIALLISKENAIVVHGMGQEEFLMKALRGAYRVFWEKGYDIEFITPEQVKNQYINKYKLVYMPFMPLIDKNLAGYLDDYVKQGGLLIGTARCGMLGENGWYNHQVPGHQLADTFGISVRETDKNMTPNITYKNKNYKGYWHKEGLEVKENVTVLARFNDDQPAVTKNYYGKGVAIFFATHPDAAYLEESSYLLWDVLDDELKEHGIKSDLEIEYTNRLYKEIDGHVLYGKEKAYIILTNYVTKNHSGFFINNQKKVRIKLRHTEYKTIKNIVNNINYEINQKHDSVVFDVTIEKNKVTMLELSK